MSACLAGRNCRYDGKNKKDSALLKSLKDTQIILFCPEDALLGTPRETIDIVDGRAVGNKSGKDYTEGLRQVARKLFAKHPDIEAFYCKSRSPSCAVCSARYYDRQKNLLQSSGTGVFVAELRKLYKNAQFIEKDGNG